MPQVELVSFACSQDIVNFLAQQKTETDGRAAIVFVQTDNLKGMAHDCGKTKQANDVAVCAKAINHVINSLQEQRLNLKSIFAVATGIGNDVKCCVFASKKKRLNIPPQNYPRITDSAIEEIEKALGGGFQMEYIHVDVEANAMEVFDGVKSKDFKGITKTKAQRKGGQSSVRFERINKENVRVNLKSFQDQLIDLLASKYADCQEDCILHFTGTQGGQFADDQEFLTKLNQRVKMFFHVYKDSRVEVDKTTRQELEAQTLVGQSVKGRLDAHMDAMNAAPADHMVVFGVENINTLFKRHAGIAKRIVSASICDSMMKALSQKAAEALRSIKGKPIVLDFPEALAASGLIQQACVLTDLPQDYYEDYIENTTRETPEDGEGEDNAGSGDVVEEEKQRPIGFEAIYYDGPDPEGAIAVIYEYCNIASDRKAKKIVETHGEALHSTMLAQLRISDGQRRQRYLLLSQKSNDQEKLLGQLQSELEKLR